MEQVDEVLKELDTAIEQKRGSKAEAYNTKSDILFALQRYNQALPAYQVAVAQEPKYAGAWIGLGNCYLQLAGCETEAGTKCEYLKNAMKAYTTARRLKPSDKGIHYQLTVTLKRMGLLKEAIRELKESLRQETDPTRRSEIETHIQQLVHGAGFGEIYLDAPVGDFDLDLIKTIQPPIVTN
jgi:tetratricopeptide (TPR) repeat protein